MSETIVGVRSDPRVPSRLYRCAACAGPVWLSVRSGAPMADAGCRVECLPCARSMLLAGDDIVPAPGALAEVLEYEARRKP